MHTKCEATVGVLNVGTIKSLDVELLALRVGGKRAGRHGKGAEVSKNTYRKRQSEVKARRGEAKGIEIAEINNCGMIDAWAFFALCAKAVPHFDPPRSGHIAYRFKAQVCADAVTATVVRGEAAVERAVATRVRRALCARV